MCLRLRLGIRGAPIYLIKLIELWNSLKTIYFDADPDRLVRTIAPWNPGENLARSRPWVDPDIKQSALTPKQPGAHRRKRAIASPAKASSPALTSIRVWLAERLKLAGAARAKAEKCLATAIYFEARTTVRAQTAVAQVVLNRAFSRLPKRFCCVVYQNSTAFGVPVHLRLRWQIRRRSTSLNRGSWAAKIARDILDGKFWMPDVALPIDLLS